MSKKLMQSNNNKTALIEEMVEHIGKFALDSSEKFVKKFAERLSTQEGIEMQIDVCQTNGYGNGAAGQHQFLKDQLQRDLSTIISKYTSELSWDQLFNQVNRQLSLDGHSSFRILEDRNQIRAGSSVSTSAPKRGILVRSGNTPASLLTHRPMSAMIMNKQNGGTGVAASDLMSQSVMADFIGNDDGALEQQQQNEKALMSGKLVHLAKQRPKPARMNRGRAIKVILEEKSNGIDTETLDANEAMIAGPSTSLTRRPIVPTASGSSEFSSMSTSLEHSLEQSPLMQQQQRKKQQQEKDAEEKITGIQPDLPTTSPPPIPKKGSIRESSTPPKLPPKPSPPATETNEDLRNKKCRVLPTALETRD